MTSDFSLNKTKPETSFGYHDGAVETVISVDDVNRQAQELAETISKEKIASLIQGEPFLKIEGLHAGYGKMEILHDFNLQVGKGQSLCMIGPNGAGNPLYFILSLDLPISFLEKLRLGLVTLKGQLPK